MEKIRMNDVTYNILAISCPAENLLKIVFDQLPENFAESMELLTEGGEVCATFTGFTTVYKQEDHTVILSNDGSVYTEPVPDPEQKELTAEEKAEVERQNQISDLESQITSIDAEFSSLDYIGIKIATGRATVEEYKEEIARMNQLADEKNELEIKLQTLQEVQ